MAPISPARRRPVFAAPVPASSVSGTGPWSWSCAGSNGGTTASCQTAAASSCNLTIGVGTNIQGAINSSPAGTVFCLPAGTWHQQQFTPQAGDQFIGDPNGGTILTGDDTMQYLYASNGTADLGGVVFENITVEHYNTSSSECSLGAIHGTNHWIFDNDTFTLNNCTGLNIGPNSTVTGGHYTYNAHAGIESGSNSGPITVQGAEIAWNNTRGDNPYNDASGLKFGAVSNVQLLNNWVHDNASVGLWCDVGCTNVTIDGNTVIGNPYEGIRYEVSSGTTYIRNNVANDNGGANNYPQIGVWSSDHVQVYDNNVEAVGDEMAILIQADVRTDYPNATTQYDTAHNNTVTWATAGASGFYGFRNFGGPLGVWRRRQHHTRLQYLIRPQYQGCPLRLEYHIQWSSRYMEQLSLGVREDSHMYPFNRQRFYVRLSADGLHRQRHALVPD